MTSPNLPKKLLPALRAHQARVSVGITTVRGQGIGVLHAARDFLADADRLDLAGFQVSAESRFLARLDQATEALRRALPGRAGTWGLARKILNIYLRDCHYSRFLCAAYRLESIEHLLEVPLDGVVGRRLRELADARGAVVSPWRSIRGLTREDSDRYQRFARALAAEAGHARVHLDLTIWGMADR
jgi:hypothetical protein